MASLWPSILGKLHKVRVCCRRTGDPEFGIRKPQAANGNGASHHGERFAVEGLPIVRESVFRKILRCSRPLVLTIAAALAFAALLRLHHAKFEDSMVRSFQRQQLDATRGLAVSVEESVANIRRGLMSLASHPDVCRLAPSMKDVLSPYLQQEQGVLDDLEVIDTHGELLWPRPGAGTPPRRVSLYPDRLSSFQVVAPVTMDGHRVASLRATVSMYRVALNSRLRTANACGSVCWMFSDSGQTVYSNAMPRERQVVRLLRSADAVKEPVGNADLLPYVAGLLFGKNTTGNPGLVEVARPGEPVDELAAFAPIHLEGRRFSNAIKDPPGEGDAALASGEGGLRYGVVLAAPKGEVSVPIVSHERVTYALIAALALLYFATGYTACRSERAHSELAEQRRMAAEQSNKAKGDFLARMSHEIRTPMNGVICMTELAVAATAELLDRIEKSSTSSRSGLAGVATEIASRSRRYMEVVRDCAYSLLSVINDILDMSKIEAGRLDLRQVPLNVRKCVADSVAFLTPAAKTKGLSLRVEVGPEVPSVVWGDPDRLRQIIANLVGNAIKFTPAGEVAVAVRMDSSPEGVNRNAGDDPGLPERPSPVTAGTATQCDQVMLRFEVRDTGPGMSPEEQKRVFTPYYQCARGGKYRPDSTGLGLPIAKQLVELMGGRISISSQTGLAGSAACILDAPPPAGQTTGTTVTFTAKFDLVTENEASQKDGTSDRGNRIPTDHNSAPYGDGLQSAVPLSRVAGPAAFRALAILLVEDNPVNRQAASIILGQWGHRVHAVESGEDALAAMEAMRFDLVLMDLEMPGMNGIEATAEIRRREQALAGRSGTGSRIPIVAMTAYAMDRDVERCLEAGMDGHLSKPFHPEQLRRVIEDVTGGSGDSGFGIRESGRNSEEAPSPFSPNPETRIPTPELCWDRAEATRMAGGDPSTVTIIIKVFLENLRKLLPQAEHAALTQNPCALAAIAHQWKGSLGLLGARRAQSSAARLEELCRLGEPERLSETFAALRRELLELSDALEAAAPVASDKADVRAP
jgi:signal transduction histidine kinase/CheY-like chemotaxis protein